ncbi:hypothetical protein CDR19_23925 [Ectopseudomonas toyotomiensis]|jgi:NhaB family Na+:H+ antiporter|nr:hypothetical protein [Pseudomonas toyotomiensis]PIA67048.1 hypothetical protein CDR19_23925 [Pseudomonas toyotomiensis]
MPPITVAAFAHNFLGQAPIWYKQAIVAFLLLNTLCLWRFCLQVAGWRLSAEFISSMAMPSHTIPLLPSGRLGVISLAKPNWRLYC